MPVRTLFGLLTALLALPPARAVAQSPVELIVAATTDVHGRLRGWDYFADRDDRERGLARAATVVDSLRAAHPGRVVVVDAGDLLQGNPLTYVAARVTPQPVHPVVAAMNAVGYDAAVIGNHEFNYGLGLLDRALADARFPFLAANVYDGADARRPYRPWTIVERAGVRVGIIGLTTPGAMVWDRDFLRGQRRIRDIVPEAARAVADVRAAGADVVVAVMHSGLDGPTSYDTAATGLGAENVAGRVAMEVRGIDLIVFGHSHRELVDSTIAGTGLVQPRPFATSVAVAALTVERGADGRWAVTRKRGRAIPVAGRAEHPAVLAATEAAHTAARRWVGASVGRTPVAWRGDSTRVRDTPLVDFVLEVMRRETGAELAATASFDLSAGLDSGAITVAALARLYPYDNTLRAVRISGAQLRAFLEQSARYFGQVDSTGRPLAGRPATDPTIPGYNFDMVAGATYVIDLQRPVGERIRDLAVRGRPVQPTDTFTMAVNNYRQGGGGGFSMLASAPVTYERDGELRQLLIDEVRRRGTIRPEDYHVVNWRLEPAAAVGPLLEAMRGGARRAPGGGGAGQAAAPGAWPAGTRFLRLVTLNDFHGQFEPWTGDRGPALGGGRALAAAVRRALDECRPTCVSLLLDGGDRFTGPLSSNLQHGRPVVRFMNALDVSATALGNHEFDWGVDTLRRRIAEQRHLTLGANVRGPDGRRPRWLAADTLIEREGLRIGVVGVAGTHTATSTHWRYVGGYRFLPPAPAIDERARALRACGATHVVAIVHDGAFCGRERPGECAGPVIDIAAALTERVDAVVAAHSHTLVDTRVRGVPVVQARSSGRAIGVIDLPLDGAGPARSEVRTVLADSTAGVPPAVDSLVAAAIARAATVGDRPVATLAVDLAKDGRQHLLGALIADAQRAVGRGDMAIMNDGGIRAPLRAGTVTYGQLYAVQPFGNPLMRLRLRGRDLPALFEMAIGERGPADHVSGVRVHWDSTAARGARVRRLTLPDGTPVRPDRTYTVILNDYIYGSQLPDAVRRAAVAAETLGLVDLAALERHLRMLPQPVRPVPDPRFLEIHAAPQGGAGTAP